MIVITDDIEFAEQLLVSRADWKSGDSPAAGRDVGVLIRQLVQREPLYFSEVPGIGSWRYLFAISHSYRSQFDLMTELGGKGMQLPDDILCAAGSGEDFHGFKNRSWVSLRGNIHLVADTAPGRELEHIGVGFIVTAVAAVLRTLDSLPGMNRRASAKWVNDILIDDAKVCGVLANTQVQERVVDRAVIGIGLNVEAAPGIVPDLFVPRTACLNDFVSGQLPFCHGPVFNRLAAFLDEHLRMYVDGRYRELLAFYRERSCIIGKEVGVYIDRTGADPEEIAYGRVTDIGEDLELYLDGNAKPISSGRVILKN
ncbi:MAG: hypothetical protein JSV44_01495 [Candidatus Zixiibacteriota bacterium]|nr:MAG: hypothetical protein JSV44_01495 [candidate division Zixibacteria bacterium]